MPLDYFVIKVRILRLSSKQKIKIVEVSPRDGLQNEKLTLSVEERTYFIEQLSLCGFKHIEAGSFVSPQWVPQLANTDQVFNKLKRAKGVLYSALVPNLQGLNDAIRAKVDVIAIFTAVSDSFTKKNINCTIAESFERYQTVSNTANQMKIPIRAYLSCIFHCPYEGYKEPSSVISICEKLLSLGCYEISLGDTTGRGTVTQTKKLLQTLLNHIPANKIAVHFHDTYGQALPNILTALDYGIQVIDSSVAGIGGCPYAKGATGNVATEDVIYMLEGMGIETDIDLNKLAQVGKSITNILKRQNRSKVSQAMLG